MIRIFFSSSFVIPPDLIDSNIFSFVVCNAPGSRLRNKFLKTKAEVDKIAYKKQRNHCVSLTRKTKKEYYSSLDEKCVIDNKKFWKTVKPFLSDKTMVDDKITLVENDEIITDDLKIAETFNNFFSEIVPNLNITTNSEILTYGYKLN